MQMNAQGWHSTCADDGFLQIEEVNGVTLMWVENAYFNCYGPPSEKWHEFNFYCHESTEFEIYKVPFGDTLEVLIGKELVVVAASSKYKRGGLVYGTSCPNVCISGMADIECFEEYISPVQPETPQESYLYNTALGVITVFSEEGFEMLLFDQTGSLVMDKQYPDGEAQVDVPWNARFAVLVFNTGHVESFILV